MDRTQEVAGSSPASSINWHICRHFARAPCLGALSPSGAEPSLNIAICRDLKSAMIRCVDLGPDTLSDHERVGLGRRSAAGCWGGQA